jgi:hypothetical protein
MKKSGFLVLLFVCVILLAQGGAQGVNAQASNRVALVVAYGNGVVDTRCVSFSENEITGYDVLQYADLPLEVSYSSMGAAICKIGNVGCPADDCFCDSPPNFWSYWHLKDGKWAFSQLGASNYRVSNGAVEGWIWGKGLSNPPDLITFDEICKDEIPPIQVEITETPTATATQSKPTKTPKPTKTALPVDAPATEEPTDEVEEAPTEPPLPEDEAAAQTPGENSAGISPSTNTPGGVEGQTQVALMRTATKALPDISGIMTQTAQSLTVTSPVNLAEMNTSSSESTQVAQDGWEVSSLMGKANSTVSTDPASQPESVSGAYLIFGVILIGLGVGLIVVVRMKYR